MTQTEGGERERDSDGAFRVECEEGRLESWCDTSYNGSYTKVMG